MFAVQVSIQIINAFVQMRRIIGQETIQHLRLSNIENKLVEHDQKFSQIFNALEQSELPQKEFFSMDKFLMLTVLFQI
ncbi:hypothetical protein SAMN05192529_1096 [Arachidicoccus rhizosphaerae]|uniref:Uncharacterized protein n=1 Tax=Arachidicoccus rhizosphaerae TaxID=551991 RepID=A0A1H3YRJ0_9BACT|nr:hypothetical protein SAMN05192529_1096 [Arachidicoccus rhizosphaerae]